MGRSISKGGSKRVFQRYRDIQERSANGEISDSGFTLIELLIVIIVLGILAAIVIFSLTGVTGQSKQAACNSDAKTAETAVSAYYAETGSYPAAWTDLTSTAGHGPYLRTAPSATISASGYQINLEAPAGTARLTFRQPPAPATPPTTTTGAPPSATPCRKAYQQK